MTSEITLRHCGPSFSALPEIAAQAEKDLGFHIEMQPETPERVMERALTDPASMDIYDMDHWTYERLVPAGVLQGIPLSRYAWWDHTHSLFVRGTLDDGRPASRQGTLPYVVQYLDDPLSLDFAAAPTETLTMVPHMMNADSLGVRSDLVSRPVEHWGDLLSPEFAGRVALVGIPGIGIMDAALALESAGRFHYADKGNMTREEIDQTIDALIDLKQRGHFYGFWASVEESVAFATSGNVLLQSMWWPAIAAMAVEGVACDYAVLVEGYRGWAGGLGIMRHVGGAKLEAAYEYLNWYNSGWAGALIAREGDYSPVPETARKYLSENEWGYWYEGKPAVEAITDRHGRTVARLGAARTGGSFAQRMGNIACWNTVMDEDDYLVERWNQFEQM
jgi:putative spermidine/putrescine transport system substrate-binding protein